MENSTNSISTDTESLLPTSLSHHTHTCIESEDACIIASREVLEADKYDIKCSIKKIFTKECFYTKDLGSGELIFSKLVDFQHYVEEKSMQWKLLADTERAVLDKPCYFLYRGSVFDCSEFVKVHPGGLEIMYAYNGKDITETFNDQYNAHKHSRYALNMLLQQKIGYVKEGIDNVTAYDGGTAYELEEQTAYPQFQNSLIIYKDFTIDQSKGLIWQAMHLPLKEYIHLISTPVYISDCKLFDCPLLEPFSKTKYWVVPLLWLPLSIFWAIRGVFRDNTQLNKQWGSKLDCYLYYPNNNWLFTNYPAPLQVNGLSSIVANMTKTELAQAQLLHAQQSSKFSVTYPLLLFFLSVLLWTLMEYILHRFIFHFEKLVPDCAMDNPCSKLLHMVLHGIHHIIPMDPNRLVFPPVLFIIMAVILYNFYGLFFNGSCLDIIASGITFGYICYDMIHYHIHHVNPTDFYFKDLKKYHHAHHYVDDSTGYGISNKLWDYIFNTACKVK